MIPETITNCHRYMKANLLEEIVMMGIQICITNKSFFNNRLVGGVLRPGGIWGRVQGVGSDHWGN